MFVIRSSYEKDNISDYGSFICEPQIISVTDSMGL